MPATPAAAVAATAPPLTAGALSVPAARSAGSGDATSKGASPQLPHAGSGHVTTASTSIRLPTSTPAPGRPAQPGSATQAKLKSLLVIPARVPKPPRHRQKQIWRRLEMPSLPVSGSMAGRAPSSKRPPAPIWTRINSAPVTCWEADESSRVNEEQDGDLSPKWHEARRKHWWRKPALLTLDQALPMAAQRSTPTPSLPEAPRAAAIKLLAGRCFCYLTKDHRVAHCRDPVRCLRCGGLGHISRSCPAQSRRPISTQLRSRLVFPLDNIHSRIAFPPLLQPNASSTAGTEQPAPPLFQLRPVRWSTSRGTH